MYNKLAFILKDEYLCLRVLHLRRIALHLEEEANNMKA